MTLKVLVDMGLMSKREEIEEVTKTLEK